VGYAGEWTFMKATIKREKKTEVRGYRTAVVASTFVLIEPLPLGVEDDVLNPIWRMIARRSDFCTGLAIDAEKRP
jgi:hypothetical protein